MAKMRTLRRLVAASAMAGALIVGVPEVASAHLEYMLTTGAQASVQHGGRTGDGRYNGAVDDILQDGECAIFQIAYDSRGWFTVNSSCGAPTQFVFSAPAGGVYVRVCRTSYGNCTAKPFSDI
jgi:hypothetical protein